MQNQLCKLGIIVLGTLLTSGGCDPIHSVSVGVQLTEPVSADCIVQTLQNTENVVIVKIYRPAPRKVWSFSGGFHEETTPTQYIVESDKRVEGHSVHSSIVQWEDEIGVHFSSSSHWMGHEPTLEVRKQAHLFNAYLARRISDLCDAKYREGQSLACRPESKLCDAAISGQGLR